MQKENLNFLGPRGENSSWARKLWIDIFDQWVIWRKSRFPDNGYDLGRLSSSQKDEDETFALIHNSLTDLQELLKTEVPTFSPSYMGHMKSDISLPALFGHISTILHNPNNSSYEVAKAGNKIEKMAINKLLEMIGYDVESGRGHVTSGGTIANFEAFWRARYRVDHWMSQGLFLKANGHISKESSLFELSHQGWESFEKNQRLYKINEDQMKSYSLVIQGPWNLNQNLSKKGVGEIQSGPVILVPANKHYSWVKAVSVFGLGDHAFWPVNLDPLGRMCVDDLRLKIEAAKVKDRPILMVVSVVGSTELGSVDSVDEIQNLLDTYKNNYGIHIWHHIDAAFGGYFCCIDKNCNTEILSKLTLNSLKAIKRSDSVTIDPHKLGFVPYSCGAILLPNNTNYRVSSFAAPYLNENNDSLLPGWSTTLEGSRSAAGAAATLISASTMALNSAGHGRTLENSIKTKNILRQYLEKEVPNIKIIEPMDTNILTFTLPQMGERLSLVNERCMRLYKEFQNSPDFAVSKTELGLQNYYGLIRRSLALKNIIFDADHLFLLRMVLMNPFSIEKESQKNYLQGIVRFIKAFAENKEAENIINAHKSPINFS
ncbi:MAG: hypothetical protein KDD50_00475 [Bdellovibrionales bacterium]|nr:hypothetical protein [Bdellovibrionales bacterium]